MSSISDLSSEKVRWQVRLTISAQTKNKIIDEAKREERDFSYIVSRIVEEFYGKKYE